MYASDGTFTGIFQWEVEFPIHCGKLEGLSLSELYARFQVQVLVCAVESGETVLIPDGDYILKAGDKLHIAASHQNMEQFFKKIALRKEKIKNAMICGGGRVAYYLASQLCNLGMNVKIIERNRERCEELCELLPKATIINGDATEHDLLIEEGIEKTDAFIALTGMDEENIIMSLFASKQSVSKVIVKINEDRRAMMIDELGLDSIVSAKTATADAILGYVRARRNSQCSANVETMYQLLDGRVEALEFIIKSENAYTGVPLKDLNLKVNNIIACIARGRKIIIPNGDDSIQVGDSVVIITMTKQIRDCFFFVWRAKRNCIFINSGHSAHYFSAGGQKKTERYEYLWKRRACTGRDCLDFVVTVRCTAVFYLRFDSRLSGCLF